MTERTLDTLATEIGGIAHTLLIMSTALEPNSDFEHCPEAYCMSLFALAEHCTRIQDELDDAHMRLEVKPHVTEVTA